jgi:uncharacterized OsmC-like protein
MLPDDPGDDGERGSAEAFDRLKSSVARAPSEGAGRFSTIMEWRSGTRSVTRARGFVIDTDEPEILGGGDAAADPMELLLAAMGSCIAVGWAKQARLRGVELRSVRVSVEATYDLRGHLDLATDVRAGFSALRYTVDVDCDADDAVLAEIKQAAERTSPLFDNLLNATPVRGSVNRAPARG